MTYRGYLVELTVLGTSLILNGIQLFGAWQSTLSNKVAMQNKATNVAGENSSSPRVLADGEKRRTCEAESVRLEAQLQRVLRQIEERQMPHERFDTSAPLNYALALELRQHLDEAHRESEVECRSMTCRISYDADGAAPVLDAEWARHNMRDASSNRSYTFFGIRDPEVASGYQILLDLEGELKHPGMFDECAVAQNEPGTMFRIDLNEPDDEFAPRFQVSPQGPERNAPRVACLMAKVQALCDRTSLPVDYQRSAILVRVP